jgi:SLOG cluster2
MQNMWGDTLMTDTFSPPLAIHFIWHPSDEEFVVPVLDSVRSYFARDVERPFSRGLNIPLFFYSSGVPTCPPSHVPHQHAGKNVIFVFTSVNTIGYKSWDTYIRGLPQSKHMTLLPVALDEKSLMQGSSGSLDALHFIRSYQWPPKNRVQNAILALAHEIYRHGFIEIEGTDVGRSSSINIFLSHAKAGNIGRLHAEAIKSFIDNTNMSLFFDTTGISPGFKFGEEIIKNIKQSTMITITSDAYSSRYWCQREILCAKEYHRPMLAVDCRREFEDRIFPAGSNIPCVHVTPEAPLHEEDILRILVATILETIRHHHTLDSLQFYKSQGWIATDCTIISRPPELSDVLKTKNTGKKCICYPEPPVYEEEAGWHSEIGVETFTPVWSSSEQESFKNFRVGISISTPLADSYFSHHLHENHLMRLAQDVARHLLARASTLLYGGDLRKNGFTQFILDEAIALKNRLNTDKIYVENHLAWPLYVSTPEVIDWRAMYSAVMDTVEHIIPQDVIGNVDEKVFLTPSDISSKYIWSRCLTTMRSESISCSDARICAGGILSGYKGKMPGVLEEILIAIDNKKPIYLLGGFGGVVKEVCESITSKAVTTPLTEKWQISQDGDYQNLQAQAAIDSNHADYRQIAAVVEGIDIGEQAVRAGLAKEEYVRLLKSPFVDECVHIIIKGLRNLASPKKRPA